MSQNISYHAFNQKRADENWKKFNKMLDDEFEYKTTKKEQDEKITEIEKKYCFSGFELRDKALKIAKEKGINKPNSDSSDEEKMDFERRIFKIETDIEATYERELQNQEGLIRSDLKGKQTLLHGSDLPYFIEAGEPVDYSEIIQELIRTDLQFGGISGEVYESCHEGYILKFLFYMTLGERVGFDSAEISKENWQKFCNKIVVKWPEISKLGYESIKDDIWLKSNLEIQSEEDFKEFMDMLNEFMGQIMPVLKKVYQGDALVIVTGGMVIKDQLLTERAKIHVNILKNNILAEKILKD